MHQGHGIAIERQVCSPISRALCWGIEPCLYFTDRNDTFIFFFTFSPHSTGFFVLQISLHSAIFCLTISSHPRVYQRRHIYVATYINTYTEGENQSDQLPFYYSTASWFTNMVSLNQNVIKDLFLQLCIVCHLCSGTVFISCFRFPLFWFEFDFFCFMRREQTHAILFFW